MIENREAFSPLSLIFQQIYGLLMSVAGSDVCRLLTSPKVRHLWPVENVSWHTYWNFSHAKGKFASQGPLRNRSSTTFAKGVPWKKKTKNLEGERTKKIPFFIQTACQKSFFSFFRHVGVNINPATEYWIRVFGVRIRWCIFLFDFWIPA